MHVSFTQNVATVQAIIVLQERLYIKFVGK